jgi:probable HAF family extracellular repeat protein
LVLAVIAFVGLSPSRAFADLAYTLTDLGRLDSRPFGFSFGNAINDAGQVTGYSSILQGGTNAFLYQGGVMSSLDPLGSGSVGQAINGFGQVAGYQNRATGPSHATLFSNGGVLDLGTLSSHPLSSSSIATGINNAGQVVGYSDTNTAFVSHAFLYVNGQMQDLGTLVPSNPLASRSCGQEPGKPGTLGYFSSTRMEAT